MASKNFFIAETWNGLMLRSSADAGGNSFVAAVAAR